MRTLIVVRSLKMGGMERVAVNLADAFADEGHESHLLVFRRRKQGLSPANPAVKTHHFPLRWWLRLTGIGLFIELVSRLLLNPLIRRSHFVWTGYLGGYLFKVWLKYFERRHGRLDRIIFRGIGSFEMVWTFHDERARFVLENTLPQDVNARQYQLFSRCLFHKKHLVAVSGGVKASIEESQAVWKFTPASVSVIVNPCPIKQIRHLMDEECPDIPEGNFIVNVARLVPQKDQALLLRAYAISNLQEKLVMVGSGPLESDLKRLACELGIEGRVIFAGNKNNPYPFMKHARLLVLSSRVEGMGIVLFEALACGTPVVSVDCRGGIREILKGELEDSIAARNETALAEKLKEKVSGDKPTIREVWLKDFLPAQVVRRFLAPGD
ncbi:glycosyltransferase [Kushneria sp. Sum13]|uniref:glycosyltransferase n=1 Tax=Kushneria sp. Sum13 TaxID=3459196 RepID=UPI00404641CE